MPDLTEEKLAELERLEAASEPGPWTPLECMGGSWDVVRVVGSAALPRVAESLCLADADFIAAARTAVPALVAEIRQLQVRQQELLATVARLSRETPYPPENADA